MKKKIMLFILSMLILFSFASLNTNVFAESYLSDKTEIEVKLDVSGAESICQTDDGYIWIAQYSGLTRYDSRDFVTYKTFTEKGVTYDIMNVRALVNDGNTLYILTKERVYVYNDYAFHNVDIDFESIKRALNQTEDIELYEIELDKTNKKLLISSIDGLIIYDLIHKTATLYDATKDVKVFDCAIYKNRFYYATLQGVFSSENNELIYANTATFDLYIYDDVLLIGTSNPGMTRYDLKNKKLFDTQFSIPVGQVNKFLYSPKDDAIFIATDKKGVFCVDAKTGSYTVADTLQDKSNLSDLLIDYENNLWISCRKPTGYGLYIITKNALLNFLFDDPIWNTKEAKEGPRGINSIERYGNILYFVGAFGIHFYDLNQKKIVVDSDGSNAVMKVLSQYIEDNNIKDWTVTDIETFKNKIYFSVTNVGLVEYDPTTQAVNIYGKDFIYDDDNIGIIKSETGTDYDTSLLLIPRCLRAFDDFLMIGYYNGGIIKFDGSKYNVYNSGKTVLNIKKANDGDILFLSTNKICKIDENLENLVEIKTENNTSLNRLTFITEGNKIYYNLNSRLFCYEEVDGEYKNTEIILPFVRGSIFEINKIKMSDGTYKYVLVTATQIYIIDSFGADNLDEDNNLIRYEMFDSTNGLKTILNSTFGYYDEETYVYYFQTSDGIFAYDFNKEEETFAPIKIAMSSVDINGKSSYGDNIKIPKYSSRIDFNLSVLAFRPNKGFKVYYKLDGIDKDYIEISEDNLNISYTYLNGGKYSFHAYAIDEFGNRSNDINITIIKTKYLFEYAIFWVITGIASVAILALIIFLFIRNKIRKAEKRMNEYKAITLESIEAIARTIDAKDSYTNGHSKRVGIYSREIAKALNLSAEEVENIYYIALLHDIGKIAIPGNILNKPGRLTDEEFEIMKSHTTAGAKILESISTIPNIVAGAKYHHEKYGGGGYPTGIKGEEIPFIARIICCADCYDAMATKRVYKDPYPKEKIISEFERCKGTQFDPHIADVVIKLIKEDRLRAGTDKEESNNEK